MANSYGYRLYKFEIYKGNARKPHPMYIENDKGVDWWYREHLEVAAQPFVDRAVHGMPPLLNGNDRSQDLDEVPVFQLVSVALRGTNLYGTIRHGRPGGYDLALPKPSLGGEATPIDISDHSPTREYRFVVYFPTVGDEAVLAVEAVSGACPVRYLTNWARRWSQLHGEDHPVDGASGPWFKPTAHALGDPRQMTQFIEKSTLLEVVLVAGGRGRSRLRRDEAFRVTSTLDVQGKESALRKLEGAIVAKKSDEEMAAELAAMLGREVADIDLDDGWIVLDTEYGRQQVSPSRIPDVFTYPIAEQRPSDPTFHREIAAKAATLASHQLNSTFDFTNTDE
ncbi:hypothetical protein JVX90_13915 [Gordonia sp. PDNC005]|uniref:hypothetical protein n=1 Tax=Gordonia sp. PDNC005 TaxID=2811424 RepID=UPI001965A450|nr:hypothetical protein [Gordonia sp. PDNC005]QRY61509.1 hypothetical protein JVX90_13915 [Gordonia sp. PDNC005]